MGWGEDRVGWCGEVGEWQGEWGYCGFGVMLSGMVWCRVVWCGWCGAGGAGRDRVGRCGGVLGWAGLG